MNTNSDKKKCLHHDRGYCRKQNKCNLIHYGEICEEVECDGRYCKKRHPRECEYYFKNRYCKFGTFCKYRHLKVPSKIGLEINDLKEKIKKLEIESNSMKNIIIEQQHKIDALRVTSNVNLLFQEVQNLKMKFASFDKKADFDATGKEKQSDNDSLNNDETQSIILIVAEDKKAVHNKEEFNTSKDKELKSTKDEILDDDGRKIPEEEDIIDNEQNIPCGNCEEIFIFHGEITNHMCDICLVRIAEIEQVYLPKKYQCNKCQKTFKTKTEFRQHKQCKYAEHSLTFICEDCEQIWKDETIFENHSNRKHKTHTCVRCNAKVEGKDRLDEHFRTKHRAF